MRLRLLGSDSAAYQREQRKQQNAVLDARREGRSTRTAEELEDEALGLLIVCTDECENLVLDGEEIPCEPAELRAFYRRFSWAAEQAGAWIVRRGHYLGN